MKVRSSVDLRADEGGHALFRDVHADVEQRLFVAVEQAQARHFNGDGFLLEAQALFVAAQGRHVDAVGMCFVLHGRLPVLTNTVR